MSYFENATPMLHTRLDDLKRASVGGMVASLTVLLNDFIPLPSYLFVALFTIGLSLLFRGFLLTGRLYSLKWVILGSRLAFAGLFFVWIAELTSWPFMKWLSDTAIWLSPFLIFVDLWPVRHQANSRLVTILIGCQLTYNVLLHLDIITAAKAPYYEAFIMALTTWFLYDVAWRLTPSQPAG